MTPVQKIVNIYKTSMDLKAQTSSSKHHFNQNSDHKLNDDSQDSFSSLLKKILEKQKARKKSDLLFQIG